MAFWDELGQKITKGSKGAFQKTRDMASVVSLNTDISDSRNRIRDLYEELGELIMQNSFTREDREKLQEMIDSDYDQSRTVELENWREIYARIISIRSEEEKIAVNRQKVSALRNEMNCPNCGTKISKGTLFCPQCGTKIVWPEPAPEAAVQEPAPEAAVQESAPEAAVQETETAQTEGEAFPGTPTGNAPADTAAAAADSPEPSPAPASEEAQEGDTDKQQV